MLRITILVLASALLHAEAGAEVARIRGVGKLRKVSKAGKVVGFKIKVEVAVENDTSYPHCRLSLGSAEKRGNEDWRRAAWDPSKGYIRTVLGTIDLRKTGSSQETFRVKLSAGKPAFKVGDHVDLIAAFSKKPFTEIGPADGGHVHVWGSVDNNLGFSPKTYEIPGADSE